jgi:Helix-turn-helix domain
VPERELQPADRFEWERVMRRCLIPLKVKAVGRTLAEYGDKDGRNIHPGEPRLAAVCGMGKSTVRRMVATLIDLGLIERLANGGGPSGGAARYRLTVPTDLLERVPMLDVDEVTPLNNMSADSGSTAPVDNTDNCAQQASGDESPETHEGDGTPLTPDTNSAQFETELRSPRASTYQETTQLPTKTSPEVSTSPARARGDPKADVDAMEAERARQLAALAALIEPLPA